MNGRNRRRIGVAAAGFLLIGVAVYLITRPGPAGEIGDDFAAGLEESGCSETEIIIEETKRDAPGGPQIFTIRCTGDVPSGGTLYRFDSEDALDRALAAQLSALRLCILEQDAFTNAFGTFESFCREHGGRIRCAAACQKRRAPSPYRMTQEPGCRTSYFQNPGGRIKRSEPRRGKVNVQLFTDRPEIRAGGTGTFSVGNEWQEDLELTGVEIERRLGKGRSWVPASFVGPADLDGRVIPALTYGICATQAVPSSAPEAVYRIAADFEPSSDEGKRFRLTVKFTVFRKPHGS